MNRIAGNVRNRFGGAFQGGQQAKSVRYDVVFDGAVYNRAELGEETSDAELVLSLVERQGVQAAVASLNADFALVIYDKQEDVLSLARDRFGVKPLYYINKNGRRAFGSRPLLVSEAADVDLEVDPAFIARFAGNHYRGIDVDPTRSPYTNVRQVPPATLVKISRQSEQSLIYWALTEQPDFATSTEELAAEYRALILDAVRRRLRASEKNTFTLSGGLDSSTVLASAVELTGQPQTAFSTVYDDATFDESADIQPMLAHHVSSWQQVRVNSPDVFTLVREMVDLHDEPVVTATWLSHYLLTKQVAAAGWSTLWGGLGGDELNAGEYEYFMYHFADLRCAGKEKELLAEVAAWAHHHDHPIWRKNMAVVEQGLTNTVDLSRAGVCRPDSARLFRYHEALSSEWSAFVNTVPSAVHPFTSYLKNRTYQDLTRETLPCCLRAEDRHAAAAGLERRLPFLDHRLVEFMWRVPGSLKIQQGITKQLLRRAMKGILPEETRTRIKKTGWNAPAHQWFVGAGREQLLDLIHSHAFRQRGIYNIPVVERLISEHEEIVQSGRPQENHMMFLWQLVNTELWLQNVAEKVRIKNHA